LTSLHFGYIDFSGIFVIEKEAHFLLPVFLSGDPMSIQGNLETFHLGSLLQILSYENKTGRLKIKSTNNEVQIILHDGDIVFATEARKNNRIGLLLMNHGLIDQNTLDECLALSSKQDQGLGKTLVQEGHLSLARLNEFLLKQAENSVYNVFLWKSGEFLYKDADLNLKGIAGRKLDTMNILLEASRRIDEFEVLKKQIPGDHAVPVASRPTESEEETHLTADERRLLSLIDGESTIRQILNQIGHDDFTGYQMIHTLISSGIVEIIPVLTAEELAEKAVSQLQAIDAKQFRETLDRLGLKRSSGLRVALNRIYRDTADTKQLMHSVEAEAKRITNPVEKSELALLRQKNRTPFMKAILQLLDQSINE
jgi:hypothetical protein